MHIRSSSPFCSILHSPAPGTELVFAIKQQAHWLPCFLSLADSIPAGPVPYHTGSVLSHTARCMNEVANDPLAVWMAFVHDAGKLTTPRHLWPHHYGHELRGESLIPVWAKYLGLPGKFTRAGILSTRLHMKGGRYHQLRAGKKFDLLHDVAASGFFASFWRVVDADTKSAISDMAMRDWQRICTIPYNSIDRDEKARQKGISLLKS